MNRKELRQMIREEVRTEILRALPKLIGEALNEVIASAPKPKGRQRRRKQVVKEDKSTAVKKSFDRSKLTALLGYGDLESPRTKSAPTPPTQTIAGVPMTGGLMAKESTAGMAHFRDYTDDSFSDEALETSLESGEMGEEEYNPQFSSIPAMVGGVDGGAEVPASIVAALGKRGKRVLDETEARVNWRPGMKRD